MNRFQHYNQKTVQLLSLYCVVCGMMCWWVWLTMSQSINTDLVYLTQSAVYFLSGEKMVDAYYDNNPPLCILIYIIPAALIKYFGVSIIYATLGYNILLTLFSSILVFAALKSITTITSSERHLITIIYILTSTWAANLYFGEKDQYILLGLFPFIFLQIIITNDYKISSVLKTIILVIGTIFIMIKPFYYIVPAIFILHRIFKTKTLKSAFKADSISLGLGAGLYAIMLLTYFWDYTSLILPDALLLYTSMKEAWVLNVAFILVFIIGIGLFCTYFLPQKPYKFASLFLFLSILCIIPYGLQEKGFYYHLLPAITFFACGLCLAIFQAVSKTIKISEKFEIPLVLLISLIFNCGYYSLFYQTRSILTHNEYKNSVLAKIIEECPREHCSYFMFNDMTEITQQLSVYTEQPHASRFASFWFLPEILSPNSFLTVEKKETLSSKYSALVSQDFKKFKPDTLILGHFQINSENPDDFNFINFFSSHSLEFSEQIKNYSFEKNIDINMKSYFPETLIKSKIVKFDIYRRNYSQNP